MYIYEDQYGWALAATTNSKVDGVRYWDDFQRVYKTRADAEKRRDEIWAEIKAGR